MNTVGELVAHPQLEARDRWRVVASPVGEIRMLKPPFNVDGMEVPMNAIPAVGEHTDAILRELGIEDAAIAQWRAAAII
jgi:itaconate CoA-transferase